MPQPMKYRTDESRIQRQNIIFGASILERGHFLFEIFLYFD
jgi:hypothetical protein